MAYFRVGINYRKKYLSGRVFAQAIIHFLPISGFRQVRHLQNSASLRFVLMTDLTESRYGQSG